MLPHIVGGFGTRVGPWTMFQNDTLKNSASKVKKDDNMEAEL